VFATDEERTELVEATVTRLTPLSRKPGHYTVELDGRGGLTITEEALVRFAIQVGDRLDEVKVAELTAADELGRATEAALVFLAHRPRAEREVRDRLRRGSFTPSTVEAVIGRLHEWRYLDDADFARRWVENRTTHRPRGRRLLQQELRQKGIDAETVREVIAEADLDEVAAAEELARRRLGGSAGEDPAAARRRVSAYLARRGYGYDVIRIALERAMGPAEDVDDPPS
jgi:regulatory protein